MELKLHEGAYVKGNYHDLADVDGYDELAQRVMMRLKAKRGGFALLPEYGSRLYTLPSIKAGQRESRAREFVAEALRDENVLLEELTVRESGERVYVDMRLRSGTQKLDITTEI